MRYKAVIIDLDGTAVDSPSQKLASPRLAAAVEALEATGVKICAATGRAESWANELLESMGLRQPAIIAGGTRIIDPVSHNALWQLGLEREQMAAVLKGVEDKPYNYLWNDYTADDYFGGGWPLKDFNALDSTYFFELVFVPDLEAVKIIEELRLIPGVTVIDTISQQAGTHDLHITNRAATKEHAIYELEKILAVPKVAMIGVGDGPNDIPLFKNVGYKVAMANAVPELKALADQVIGDVKDDGLAVFFEKLALEGGEL